MKKIFVAGGSGMLGTAFYEVFKNDYHLKITDKAEAMLLVELKLMKS